MQPEEADWTVTGPGVVDGMPPDCYHADPIPDGSLSSGGVKRLLPPSCPAKFRHWADNPPAPKREFDFGHAAHKLILGAGSDIEVIAGTGKDENCWRTNDDKAAVEAAHDAGRIPLTPRDMEKAEAMAAAIREHPVAGPLFEPGTGSPEQSAFWRDPEFGIWRRARFDWLPHWLWADGRLTLPDYKTCASAYPADLEKVVVQHGYDQQAAWYMDAAEALGLCRPGKARWMWVFQEKTPPYVVTPMRPDDAVLERGRARNRLAMATFLHCQQEGVWPGYLPGVGDLGLPRWVLREFDDDMEHGYYDVKART